MYCIGGYGKFEELKDEGKNCPFICLEVSDRHSAAKNLSLQLINTETTSQVLNIFENDYIKSGRKDIYVEELCLLLHFATKHMGSVANDIRMSTLLDMLYARFDNVDFDFVLTTIWAFGILTSYRGMQTPLEHRLKILSELEDKSIPEQSIPNIPSLIFSIS